MEEEPIESWRMVWRKGAAPLLSTAGLEALRQALASDSPKLLQGATTVPPPLQCVAEWPVEGACLLGLCGWQGDGLTTVEEVQDYFGMMCAAIDERLGEPAGVRWLLNAYDTWGRQEMIGNLLPEVEAEIQRRLATQPASAVE